MRFERDMGKSCAKIPFYRQSVTKSEGFDICFCARFDRCYQKLIFGGETEH